MVQVRRRVNTEEDRYGGYNRQPVTKVNKDDFMYGDDNLGVQDFSLYSTPRNRIFPSETESAGEFGVSIPAPEAPYKNSSNPLSANKDIYSRPQEHFNPDYGKVNSEKYHEKTRYYNNNNSTVNYAHNDTDTYLNERAEDLLRPAVKETYKTRKETDFYSTKQTAAPSQTTYQSAKQEKFTRKKTEDIMPSIMKGKKEAENTASKSESTNKDMSRSKVVLAVYVLIVLVLVAIVIGTGVAISEVGSSVNSLEYRYAQQNAVIDNQSKELYNLSNDSTLAGMALENGMEKIDNYTEMELINAVKPTVYESKTNWFDQFCDWLSNLIG